jgi:hypothetical protein
VLQKVALHFWSAHLDFRRSAAQHFNIFAGHSLLREQYTMTQSFDARLHDVVIASGASATRAISGAYEYSDAVAIVIQSPATLDALTFTLEVSNDGSTWATLSDGITDLTMPGAGKSKQFTEMLGSRFFRIKSSGNVAADRTFLVSKQWTA